MKNAMISRMRSAVRSLLPLILAVLAPLAHGAISSFQISQIADSSREFGVFVRGERLPTYDGGDAASARYDAALGGLRVPVLSVGRFDASASGISLVLAIDVSASLSKGDFGQIKKLTAALLSQLSPASRVAVIAIGSDVRLVSDFSGDLAAVRNAIASLAPNDQETALYEAILKSQEIAARSDPMLPKRRAVLVITDGIDDSRRGYSKDEVMRRISEGVAPVFAVGLPKARATASQREALRGLAQVSRASGGAFEQVADDSLAASLESLRNNIEHVYLVRLDCNQCVRDGTVQRLQLIYKGDKAIVSDSRDVRLFTLGLAATDPKGRHPKIESQQDPGWFGGLWSKSGAIIDRYPWVPWIVGAAFVFSVIVALAWIRSRVPADAGEDIMRTHGWDTTMHIPGVGSGARRTDGITHHGSARQLTLATTGRDKQVVSLNRPVTLGRAADNVVVISGDSEASSRHAEIAEHGGVPVVADLGSKNGTYLNGTRILRPEPLSDGDLIVIGRTEIRVYYA